MYTKDQFRNEIRKVIVDKGYNTTLIAKNAYEIYVDHIREIDRDFRAHLLDIANMDMGPEFEMTEKEFNEFIEKM